MRAVVVVVCALALSACQIQVVKMPRGIKPVSAQGVVEAQKSIYVAQGPDGSYRRFPTQTLQEAPGSGKAAATVVFAEVQAYQARTVLGTAMETEAQALESARRKGLDYVLYTRVNEWTDATYLTCTPAYPDRLDVDLAVYDVATGKAVRLDKLYNGGCPVRVGGIPVGVSRLDSRFRQILRIWLAENLRERR